MSKSCKVVCLDEIDQFSTEHPQNVRDGWKRTRSFSSCMEFAVCSPTTQQGHIWQEFLKGSQAYYTLRCKHCGELTMRSCDIANLQFESEYNEHLRTYMVKKGTERLVCPKCKHEHTEDDKKWCIQNGDYVHSIEELKRERPSFQIGALASQLPSLCWSEIANAALEAGKSSDISVQQNFDNSWRGLPWKQRQIQKDDITNFIHKHTWSIPPSLENVEMLGMTVDVMDDFYSWGIFAFDVNDNTYLIDCGETPYLELDDVKRRQINEERAAASKPPIVTIEDVLDKEYLVKDGVGLKPLACCIDQGGHKADLVKSFTKHHRQVIQQKGTSMSSLNWRESDNQERLIITNEKYFRSLLIYIMYSQNNKRENYFYISPDIDEEYVKQIVGTRPDNSSKWR